MTWWKDRQFTNLEVEIKRPRIRFDKDIIIDV